EKGNIISASQLGMGDDWPLELHVTVTFEAVDGKTRLTLHHSGIPAGQMRELTSAGWHGSLDKLAEVLAKT
ncbi:MAG: SRPBCC domain-containing protein, partial [Candidatus Hydrogenedentales bacterium]